MTKIQTSLVSLAALLAASVSASAADLYAPAPASSPFAGFYIGGFAGYGTTNTKGDFYFEAPEFDDDAALDYDQDGGFIGVELGANWVTESGFMFGASVSGAWANLNGEDFYEGDGPFGAEYQRTIDAIALAEGKIGFVLANHIALYASGGLALAHHETDVFVGSIAGYGLDSWDDMSTGWTVGAGADMMVSDHISVGLKYNYVDFGGVRNGSVNNLNDSGYPYLIETNTSMDMHLINANVKYHF